MDLALKLGQVLPEFGESIENGVSLEAVTYLVTEICNTTYSAEAVELCSYFMFDMYGLEEASNQERLKILIRLISMSVYVSKSKVIKSICDIILGLWLTW